MSTITPTVDSFMVPLPQDVDKASLRDWMNAVEAAVELVGDLQGFKAGLQYTFSTTTAMADPGPGLVRFNNATIASVTAIAIDDLTFDGVDVSAWIPQWDDSTATIKGQLVVVSNTNADPTTAVFNITGLTDNAGWTQLAVTFVSGTLPSNSERIALQFYRAGDSGTGDVTGPASSTNNNLAAFNGITGKTLKDAGFGLSDVARLSQANTFNVPSTQGIILQCDDAGNSGAVFDFYHNSASPAAADVVGQHRFLGKDSGGTQQIYGLFRVQIVDPTAASMDSTFEVQTQVAGSRATRIFVGGGVYHQSATGTDKGNNTINFGAVYDDNTLLTCMALQSEFLDNGKVDLKKWDALVPDQIEPELSEELPIMETVRIKKIVLDKAAHGFVARETTVKERRQAVDWTPVYDENGNGIDAIGVPAVEVVKRPARVIKREHRTARVFKAMLESGFDPREPEQYFAKLRADEALPGMPNQKDWKHNELCAGEMHNRLWLAAEMLAIVVHVMWGRLTALETRVAKLEPKRKTGG